MLFKKQGAIEYLVVGLGNPGTRYTVTRHNAGFLTIDLFAQEHSFRIDRLKFHALIADRSVRGHRCIFMKPQTFMNLSGEAVAECANFYKIPPENVIVIFDDVSSELGNVRIKRKGSAGGHNGIKSIISSLGSQDFPRIKMGVGERPHPDFDLADWVLTPLKPDELRALRGAADNACKAIELMLDGDIDEAMNRYSH